MELSTDIDKERAHTMAVLGKGRASYFDAQWQRFAELVPEKYERACHAEGCRQGRLTVNIPNQGSTRTVRYEQRCSRRRTSTGNRAAA